MPSAVRWKAADGCEDLRGGNVELAGTEEKADGLSADTLTWSASSQMPETPDTSYSLSVFAVDLAGNVSVPVNISQRLDTVAPEAPTDLVLIDGAGTDNAGKNTDNRNKKYIQRGYERRLSGRRTNKSDILKICRNKKCRPHIPSSVFYPFFVVQCL